jgi:glycerol-3-phosphate dehydrogenase
MLGALVNSGEPFDLLVVGGGITGVGVALDAANRGLRVALVERDDLASGTSSKSSKLVHGGLRYLQNGDVRLVYEALHERRRLMQNAPHMVEVLPFLLPILTKDGVISKKVAKALGSALWMYDLTGGWRIGKRHRRLSASQAAGHFPTTHLDRLSGGYLYYDATADDARLTLTIAKTAAERGAVIVTRCAVVEVTHDDDGHVSGAVVEADSGRFVVAARAIVNAAGVWTDEVRALDEQTNPDTIRPAKGVHVTLPWSLVRNDIAVVIPVRRDKRSLFIVPWGDLGDGTFRHVYVGTTDTDFDDSMEEPSTTGDDIDYILEALNQSLDTDVNDTVTVEAITGVWAGLRPLVKAADDGADDTSTVAASTKDLSRRHQVSRSDSGVVTVTGGKLTTYRQMAEDAVDEVVKSLPRGTTRRRLGHRSTRRLKLAGSRPPAAASATPVERHLVRRFGTQIDEVRALIAFDASLGEPLVAGLSYLRAEVVFAARHEMATTLDDVVMRRTRAHLEDRDATLRAAPDIVQLLQAELGWTDDEAARQLEHYRSICAAEEAASGHVTHPTH